MNNNLAMEFVLNKENISVNIKREFAANLDSVWEAWTNPEILDQWWAPKPFTSRTKSMNFKVGGRRFYAMISTEGQENWGAQDFISINPKTNFKYLSLFTDSDGNANSAFPPSEWDLNFSEHHGVTTLNITIKRDSLEDLEKIIEMGFKTGFTNVLVNLDDYFASLKK